MKKNSSTYRIFEHIRDVDISEQDIYDYDIDILNQLLIDHTMSAKARAEANGQNKVVNIFWATSDYEGTVMDENGRIIVKGFQYKDEIKPENITGRNRRIVMPRVLKDKQAQIDRTKDKAEVFTPSWVCNAQNNLIDEAWSVGDASFQAKAEKVFKERKAHSTLIVVSHSVATIRKNCDSAAVLHGGILTLYDKLDDALRIYMGICHARQ